MVITYRLILLAALVAVLSSVAATQAASSNSVHAVFDLATPNRGPFPSDSFTVPDVSHLTGRRVSLPYPDCVGRPSDCEDLDVLNTLDGFNLQPRLSIPFDGSIDVTTVNSQTVFLLALTCHGDANRDNETEGECDDADHGGVTRIGINQVVWDPASTTLHVKSDELLDQHARYALIVTRGIRDDAGQSVEATDGFRHFRQTVRGAYKRALLEAIHAARTSGVREEDIAVASVFTTQSATAVLEMMREQIKAGVPEPADFNLGPNGFRTVFARSDVAAVTFREQTRVNPPGFTSVAVPVNMLDIPSAGTVGTIAFGKFNSPDYEIHPGEFIPPVGTRTGMPKAQGTNEIYYLFLPAAEGNVAGWPVVIYAHGAGGNKNQQVFSYASTFAAHGIATIAIN